MFCPKCKANCAHRTHRHGPQEYVASIFNWYPYRCACGHRFLQARSVEGKALKREPPDREIKASRSALRWRGRRREMLVYTAAILLAWFLVYFITRRSDAGD